MSFEYGDRVRVNMPATPEEDRERRRQYPYWNNKMAKMTEECVVGDFYDSFGYRELDQFRIPVIDPDTHLVFYFRAEWLLPAESILLEINNE